MFSGFPPSVKSTLSLINLSYSIGVKLSIGIYSCCFLPLPLKLATKKMKAWLVKPVKHGLGSRSSVFTPVSPIPKTKILSGKYLDDIFGYQNFTG